MEHPQAHGAAETVLGEALHAHARLAPPATELLDAVLAKAARKRTARRRGTLFAAAGAVLAAAVCGTFAAADLGSHRPEQATAQAVRASSGATRAVSYHGLEVDVPHGWGVNALECGTPVKDTVVIDQGPTAACSAVTPGRVFQSVSFTPLRAAEPAPATTRTVVVSGRNATAGTQQLPDGLTRRTLALPGLDVSMDVRTTSPALAATIIASARIVATDTNGCPSQVKSLHPQSPADRAGADGQLVPGEPTAAAVCHYTDNRLGHSTRLTDRQLGELVHQANSLRPGLKQSTGASSFCAVTGRDAYIIRFSYSSGPPLRMYLHLAGCDHRGADTGTRTGGLTLAFATAFFQRIDPGYGGTTPGDLH